MCVCVCMCVYTHTHIVENSVCVNVHTHLFCFFQSDVSYVNSYQKTVLSDLSYLEVFV